MSSSFRPVGLRDPPGGVRKEESGAIKLQFAVQKYSESSFRYPAATARGMLFPKEEDRRNEAAKPRPSAQTSTSANVIVFMEGGEVQGPM